MDCREFNKKIPDFLEDELRGRTLKSFMGHISECKDCKEELSIQFLIREAMISLEDGDAFDLQHELDRRLEEARRRTRLRAGFHLFVYGVEIAVIITIITVIVLIVLL